MGDDVVTFVLTCDVDDVDELGGTLRDRGAAVQTTPRRNLDGAVISAWFVVATVAIQTAPNIIDSLREFVTRKRVREIKIGDMSISNPHPDDIAKLIELFAHRDGHE